MLRLRRHSRRASAKRRSFRDREVVDQARGARARRDQGDEIRSRHATGRTEIVRATQHRVVRHETRLFQPGEGSGLDRVDFVAQMRGAVETGLAEARLSETRAGRDIKSLDALRKRVRRHEDGRNLFVDRLDAQIEAKEAANQTTRRRIVMLEMARTELGNYGSEVELIAALEGTR